MTIQEKFDLTGRVAVVTGGVGLLGAEFCRTLAEAGAAVAVVDLNAIRFASRGGVADEERIQSPGASDRYYPA